MSWRAEGRALEYSGPMIGSKERLMRSKRVALGVLRELSASLADLGTFLPLVLGVLLVVQMDPTGVLVGFGVFALASGALYRRPIPVQPMKAVAAMGIAGLLSAETMVATTLVMGLVLLALSWSDGILRLRRWIPNSLMHGLKLSLALSLIWVTQGGVQWQWVEVCALLGVLIALQWTPLKPLSALLVMSGGLLWLMPDSGVLALLSFDPRLPPLSLPDLSSMLNAITAAALPQLVLTVTNALILTAVIAQEYFPADNPPITEQRLARSSGWANLLLAPLGAMPMCHGAGGLVAHHALGGRTGWTIALFGIGCLTVGLGFGHSAVALLAIVPGSLVVMLLLYAAWQIVDPATLMRLRPSCYAVIGVMVITSWAFGLLAAIAVGWVAEAIRTRQWGPMMPTN